MGDYGRGESLEEVQTGSVHRPVHPGADVGRGRTGARACALRIPSSLVRVRERGLSVWHFCYLAQDASGLPKVGGALDSLAWHNVKGWGSSAILFPLHHRHIAQGGHGRRNFELFRDVFRFSKPTIVTCMPHARDLTDLAGAMFRPAHEAL